MFNRILDENDVVYEVTMLTTIIKVNLQMLIRVAGALYETKLYNLY